MMRLTKHQLSVLRELEAGSFIHSTRFRPGYWLGRRKLRQDTIDALWKRNQLVIEKIKPGAIFPDGTKNESRLSSFIYKARR